MAMSVAVVKVFWVIVAFLVNVVVVVAVVVVENVVVVVVVLREFHSCVH